MELNDGKNRKTQKTQRRSHDIWDSESFPRILGDASRVSGEPGAYQIGVGREDSHEPNPSIPRTKSIAGITGKLISQLVHETEKQLAYYEQQSALLRERLEELKQISDISEKPS